MNERERFKRENEVGENERKEISERINGEMKSLLFSENR